MHQPPGFLLHINKNEGGGVGVGVGGGVRVGGNKQLLGGLKNHAGANFGRTGKRRQRR